MPALLAGSGLDSRALALVNCSRLADHPLVPAGLVDRLTAQAASMNYGSVVGQPALPPDALPEEAGGLVAWGLPLVCDHPMQIGSQLGSLWALVELWPHAQRAERHLLRRLWYWSLRARKAQPGSWATREDLTRWQRDLPTLHGCGIASPNALAGMLEEEQAEGAHHALAGYLGPDLHLPTLGWMLGGLAGRALLRRFDHRNQSQQTLLGSIACEQLAPMADPAVAVVVFSQLAHEIWWTYRSDRRPLLKGEHDTDASLEEAVRRGDCRAAQRAARLNAGRPELLWGLAFRLLDELAVPGNEHWPRLLTGVVIAKQRAGSNPLGPDDAAVLGSTMASVLWFSGQHQVV